MSVDAGVPLAMAEQVAQAIVHELAYGCMRIEVAGSVRRRRPQVHDLELVAVPRITQEPSGDLFGTLREVDQLAVCLALLKSERRLVPHPERPADGPKYKRLWATKAGLQVDLFIVRPPAEFGPIFAIRTGPAEFSQDLVWALRRGGWRCEDGRVLAVGAETLVPRAAVKVLPVLP